MKAEYAYNAVVLKIVDADTLDVSIDLGFTVQVRQRVRLNGINAPEKNTEPGMAAKNWLAERVLVGDPVVIKSQKPGGGDKYGRYLATVYVGSTNMNLALVEAGHAFAWDGQGVKPT